MTNISDSRFDEPREHSGFRCLRARLSRQAGSDRLGLSLRDLPPGASPRAMFRLSDTVDYHEGEQPPR
jgi:hypothetical protein